MRFVPDAVVYHQHVSSISRYFKRKFKIGYWRVAVYKQHPTKLRGDSHTPQVAKFQMLLVTFTALTLAVGLLLKAFHKPAPASWLKLTAIFTTTIYGFSTVPFSWRTWREDKSAALVAPLLLLVRAVALASGAIAGILNQIPFK